MSSVPLSSSFFGASGAAMPTSAVIGRNPTRAICRSSTYAVSSRFEWSRMPGETGKGPSRGSQDRDEARVQTGEFNLSVAEKRVRKPSQDKEKHGNFCVRKKDSMVAPKTMCP